MKAKEVVRVCLQQGCTHIKKGTDCWKNDASAYFEATSRYATCEVITDWCHLHKPRQWKKRQQPYW